MDEDPAWKQVESLVGWLDDAVPAGMSRSEVQLLRILKITEEAGEVAEAVTGAMGGNPRKGRSHTWEDVQEELADVVVTAMVALHTVSGDGETALNDRLRRLVSRAGLAPGPTT
ncbi:MazG-like family protein [Streptomyces sp. NRRL S-350]|uniref:MazG-like family protein n=1 Tax=Streptomyces sp. NRRL S-350 TaxID=1463902 RepID=UPI0004BE8281|nr:MazG-like family protein [Streptomyces sp. NRRL S-350]